MLSNSPCRTDSQGRYAYSNTKRNFYINASSRLLRLRSKFNCLEDKQQPKPETAKFSTKYLDILKVLWYSILIIKFKKNV